MPEIREVVWCLGLEWRYEIGCRKLRSRLNSWAEDLDGIPTALPVGRRARSRVKEKVD